ncbi:polysaccharide biosynthesis protein GtrA [Paraburkholderia steynii]|uniref:Polysaccharide biosynthesis protein GtrA n=1 Tax=Paraburkholderia steynii TaxID=1245441 RepID=A0A4R0XJF3_9BURK|nr:polysaccharide biosynthesis protein GtrA [Paraburkholderia steynii]
MLRRLVPSQFSRFLIVGLLNSLFGYGCFAVFLACGVHYTLALLGATVLGVLFNFKTTGKLVFQSHSNKLIFRFVGAYCIVYATNLALMKALLLVGASTYASGAALLLPMAGLSFFLNKRFVFKHD